MTTNSVSIERPHSEGRLEVRWKGFSSTISLPSTLLRVIRPALQEVDFIPLSSQVNC